MPSQNTVLVRGSFRVHSTSYFVKYQNMTNEDAIYHGQQCFEGQVSQHFCFLDKLHDCTKVKKENSEEKTANAFFFRASFACYSTFWFFSCCWINSLSVPLDDSNRWKLDKKGLLHNCDTYTEHVFGRNYNQTVTIDLV